jgi:hypothetical protein
MWVIETKAKQNLFPEKFFIETKKIGLVQRSRGIKAKQTKIDPNFSTIKAKIKLGHIFAGSRKKEPN